MTTSTTPPTVTADPSAGRDPRVTLAQAVATAGTVIEAVRPDQLDLPSPCPDLDVRHLLAHLVQVLDLVAAVGRGDADPMSISPDPTVDDDGWLEAWSDAAQRVQDAWADDATLEKTIELPWATYDGGAALEGWVAEVSVHTWDLAQATGQSPSWDDPTLAVGFRVMQIVLPAGQRMADFEEIVKELPPEYGPVQPPFAEAVPVPADAPLIDRLVAWTGRQP